MNLKSISVLTIHERTLFIGDSYQGIIFAVELPQMETSGSSEPLNLKLFDRQLANVLGVTLDNLTVNGMAIDTQSQQVYVGATICHGGQARPVVAIVQPDEKITQLDLANLSYSQFNLENLPDEGTKFWGSTPARSLIITDIKYAHQEIYVAGLSNAEFASTLYRISYPFTSPAQGSSIEIYHAVHNQNETRAPIRALAPVTLNGQNYILAAYTCTPLVTISVADLQAGAHVKGKTIAELGYGNVPLQILPFQMAGTEGNESYLLITHKNREAMVLRLKDIEASQLAEGISQPVQVPQQSKAGVEFMTIPLVGALAIDNQNDQFFIVLRRNADDGSLELVSVRKGFYFRLSDFINEYDFPAYQYPESDAFQQSYMRPAHQLLKTDEGYAHLIK